MSALIVSDSTCLIGLHRIGRTNVLTGLFTTIHIPFAVHNEVGFLQPWMKVEGVQDLLLLAALETQLDRGEAEAIALAAERKADLLILDEKKGRRIAREMGLRISGTIGLLVRARREGIIPACRPLLDALEDAHFHISPALRAEALRLAGESDSP